MLKCIETIRLTPGRLIAGEIRSFLRQTPQVKGPTKPIPSMKPLPKQSEGLSLLSESQSGQGDSMPQWLPEHCALPCPALVEAGLQSSGVLSPVAC